MGRPDRLKARLLREAVDENIAVMNGLMPKPLRRGRRLTALWGRRSAAALFFLVLVGGLRLVPGLGTAVAGSTSAGPIGGAPVPAHAATPVSAPAAVSYQRPQRLSLSALALGVRRIVIDAGHGGTSLGTFAANGLREKDITLDIAERLRRRLATEGVAVLMTRERDDTISLEDRSDMANRGHGDLFLSIHLNALTSKSRRGIETYYLGPSEAPAIDAVAAVENKDSGYSLADLKTLVDMIYLDARKDESRRFAESMQRALLRDLRRVNPAIEDRGVKTAPFVVLAGTRMPAILAEVSCLSNDEEAELLRGQGYRQTIADALFDGLHAYLDASGTKETGNGN